MMDEIPVQEETGGQANGNPERQQSSAGATSQQGAASRLVPADITREEAIRRLRGVNRFTEIIAESKRSLDTMVKLVARMLSDMIGDQVIITLLNADKDTYHIAAYHDPDPRAADLLRGILDDSISIPREQGWVASAIRDDRPILLPGISPEQAAAANLPSFVEYAREIGIASMLVVPIHSRSGIQGAVTISRHAGGRPYTQSDQAFLEEIADRVGVGVENLRLIDSLRQELSVRRFATEALAASEQRFLSIFHSSPLGIKVMDLVGTILEANPAFQALTGYAEGDLVAMQFYDIVHPDDVGRVRAVFDRLKMRRETRARLEHRIIRRDGSVLWANTTFAAVERGAGDGAISIIFGITEDLTERKKADGELLELKRHLQRNIELERLRLAQNLHDAPLQELYAVIYKLEELRTQSDEGTSRALAGVVDDIQKTLNALRSTASELRPPALSRFGLEKAIRSYVQDFEEKHPGIHVRLALARDRQGLPENVRLTLFRVMQEALANVARHSEASEVQVRFSYDAEEARIEIVDNGKGFEVPANWIDVVRKGHYGLAGMAERVGAAGGTLAVESSPGMSTVIRAVVPCAE